MPSDAIDFTRRAHLTELMDAPCSREVLRGCLRDIALTNRWTLAYRPTLCWLDSMTAKVRSLGRPVRILDVGSGYGDGLRRVERWARDNSVEAELTGLDLNPDAAAISAEASPADSRIQWTASDVFAFKPAGGVDFVISSLFTHHLAESEIVRFLEWMESNATLGWFVNDLSRASTPYYLFRLAAWIAGLHPFVQNDGPVSIARAFVPEDWKRMCAAAGLDEITIQILPFIPARLCVSRRKLR